MSSNYLKGLVSVTVAVLVTSVSVCAFAMANVRYESGKIDWVDVQSGEIGLSRATPNGMRTTAYQITDHSTRVTNPADTAFLNIYDLWAGEEVTIEVIDGQKGEIVQKIIIGSSSPYNSDKHQQVALSEVKARDLANGTVVSIVGPRGPVGPAGAAGEQGLVGTKGAPGVALRGARGKQGPAGPMGEQGLTGPRGPAGDIVRGASGAAGPAGAKGQQGEAGKVGEQGDSLAGLAGPRGAVGPQGERGPVGKAGAKGPDLVGPTGPAGSVGQAGSQGIAGVQGPQGSTTAGIAGLAGHSGTQGAQGKMGADGDRGFAGQVNQWVSYKEFNFDSKETRLSKKDKKMIEEIAQYIKSNPTLQLGIDGTAVKMSDQALNDRRVKNIRRALIDAGISSNKITSGELDDKSFRRKGRVSVLFATSDDYLTKK